MRRTRHRQLLQVDGASYGANFQVAHLLDWSRWPAEIAWVGEGLAAPVTTPARAQTFAMLDARFTPLSIGRRLP